MDLNQEGEKTNPKLERSQRQQSVILWIVVVLAIILSTCALALSIYASVAKTDNDSKLEETNAKFDRIASTVNDMSSLLMQISSNTTKQNEERIANLETYRIASVQQLNSLQELIEKLNTSMANCNGSCFCGRENTCNGNATSQALESLYNMLNVSLEQLIGDLAAQNVSAYMALNSLKILFQALNDTVENQLPHELSEAVTGLSGALNQAIDTQQIQYQQLNATVATSLMNLFSQFQQVNKTAAELNDILHELSVNVSNQGSTANVANLTAGCVQVVATCVINHNNVGTPPASAVCETGLQDVDVPGFRNINIYCYVDNSAGETNPLTSTLNIFNGEASCLCSLIALTTPTASPECRMTIQRCPDTIRLGTPQLT